MYTNVLIYDLIQQVTMTVTTSFDWNSSRNSKELLVFAYFIWRSFTFTDRLVWTFADCPIWTTIVHFRRGPILTISQPKNMDSPFRSPVHLGPRFSLLTGPFLVQSVFWKISLVPLFKKKIGKFMGKQS